MDMTKPIYLDYNATTPIDPAVREAMLPYLDDIKLMVIPANQGLDLVIPELVTADEG